MLQTASTTITKSTALSNLIFLAILIIGDSLVPDSTPNPDDKMSHDTPIICSMPVRSSRGRPNNIARLQPLGNATLITNPATTSDNLDHLALFMSMPMGAGAGCERDIGDRCILSHMDRIQVDVAAESFGGLDAFGVRLEAALDNKRLGV